MKRRVPPVLLPLLTLLLWTPFAMGQSPTAEDAGAVTAFSGPGSASGALYGHASAAANVDAGPPQVRRDRDFLFGPPRFALGLRGGVRLARANSDIYEFVTDLFTLERRDFHGGAVAGEIEVRLHPRLDALVGIGYSSASARSEYRDWVDEDDLPIRQRTELRQVPVTGGLKVYLTSRGHSIGRFAWIPERTAFYAGGGGGMVHYRFLQEGEFVDFEDLWIFEDTFVSDGWTPTGHLFAGVDYGLSPRTVLSLEARQSWARSEMDRDFVGFDPIDLSGFQITAGVRWRF